MQLSKRLNNAQLKYKYPKVIFYNSQVFSIVCYAHLMIIIVSLIEWSFEMKGLL